MKTKRRNPATGKHPDLFKQRTHSIVSKRTGKVETVSGETPIFVPVEDLSEEELLALPFSAFTADELVEDKIPDEILRTIIRREKPAVASPAVQKIWDSLGDGLQEELLENDPESEARVAAIVDEFVKRYKWVMEPDEDERFREVEDQFEYYLGELDIAEAKRRAGRDFDLDDLIESWLADGFSEEQVEEAVMEALQDQNNYKLTSGTDYGHAFFKISRGTQQIYFDRDDIDSMLEGLFPGELEYALAEVEKRFYFEVDQDRFVNGKWEYSIDIDTDDYVDADPDWDKIENAVKETLKDVDPDGKEKPPVPRDQARVVHQYKDGAFVYDLIPDELPREGASMGHCVGRPGMGYGTAVYRGEIKILSVRTEAGRPKFTLECGLAKSTDYSRQRAPNKWGIVRIHQFKGKANRLPGWDLGKVGQGKVKQDEVEKAIELVIKLGLDPTKVHDLSPGIDALPPAVRAKALGVEEEVTVWTEIGQIENPRRKSGASCGAHGENCTGFCAPYRPR